MDPSRGRLSTLSGADGGELHLARRHGLTHSRNGVRPQTLGDVEATSALPAKCYSTVKVAAVSFQPRMPAQPVLKTPTFTFHVPG